MSKISPKPKKVVVNNTRGWVMPQTKSKPYQHWVFDWLIISGFISGVISVLYFIIKFISN